MSQSAWMRATHVRNFVFGVEDSLVSTVGLVSGIAAARIPRADIITTGVVLIFVEAFSMAIGSFLSEESAEEYLFRRDGSGSQGFSNGLIMFFSYFLSGFVPLGPYMLFTVGTAFWLSIVFSIFALILLGLASGRIVKMGLWRSALRMAFFGSLAIAVGVIVGVLQSRA